MQTDDRTNALGLFNYAHSYWASAVSLQGSDLKVTHPDAPIDYLYFHAIELYLKAFLRLKGFSVKELVRLRHGISKLHETAVAKGLQDDDEDRRVIGLIEKNYLRARYIRTGFFTKAHPDCLFGVCQVLHWEIEPQVNAAYGLTRVREIPYRPEA